MKFTVLASGSKGNCTYIKTKSAKLIIDAGITHRQMMRRLHNLNLDLDHLDGILITHEHTDHVKGLNVTLKHHEVPVYISRKTFDNIHFKSRENIDESLIKDVFAYEPFMINNLKITPFSVSHDAEDTMGYVLEEDGKKFVYVTDIGYLPKSDYPLLQNAHGYVFESNYDVTLLFTSNRPFYLKQRIDSVKGHMSNMDSAYNMSQLIGINTSHIILAHPSQECNTEKHVLDTYHEVFDDYGIDIDAYNLCVAKQDIPTKVFKL